MKGRSKSSNYYDKPLYPDKQDTVQPLLGEDNAEPAFYYHGDHLDSASYVTASNGEVVQTLNYLPYGEDWVDLQNFNVMPYDGYKLGVYKLERL